MNFYLDQINPLQDLDLPGVLNLIARGQRGYYARLQWTYYFIEKKGPVTRAVKRRLMSALSGLDWNIKQADVDDPEKKALAEKQAATLRENYEAIANLRAALTFLALADLRGFSHLEKIYAGSQTSDLGPLTSETDPWQVVELRIVEQWFWARNGFYGEWLYNQDARETNSGEPIDLAHYVIHQVDDPADEIFTELEVKRRVNDSDWDGFLEDYGVPPLFIVGPPNVPRDREAEYQHTAELTVSAARGYLPNGSDLKSPSATGSGGAGVFSERLKYLDEQIVIAGTAGKLTVLSEAGSGTLAGNAQKEAFDEIAQAIANNVATVLQKQFDQPLLARLHPNEPVLAYFEFAQINIKDTGAVFDDAVKATTAGYRIAAEELSEKTGYDLEYVGAQGSAGGSPAVPGGSPGTSASGATSGEPPAATREPRVLPDPEQINALLANASRQLVEAQSADLVPLRRLLETTMLNPTPEVLQTLLAQLAQVQDQLGTSEAGVRAKALGTALATGLTS